MTSKLQAEFYIAQLGIPQAIKGNMEMGQYSEYHYAALPLAPYIYSFLFFVFYVLDFRGAAGGLRKAGLSCPRESAWLLLLPFIGIIWFCVLMFQLKQATDGKDNISMDRSLITFGFIAGISAIAYLFASMPIITLAVSPLKPSGSDTYNFVAGLSALLLGISLFFGLLHWWKLISLRKSLS